MVFTIDDVCLVPPPFNGRIVFSMDEKANTLRYSYMTDKLGTCSVVDTLRTYLLILGRRLHSQVKLKISSQNIIFVLLTSQL